MPNLRLTRHYINHIVLENIHILLILFDEYTRRCFCLRKNSQWEA